VLVEVHGELWFLLGQCPGISHPLQRVGLGKKKKEQEKNTKEMNGTGLTSAFPSTNVSPFSGKIKKKTNE
jgi:hypothetical protein